VTFSPRHAVPPRVACSLIAIASSVTAIFGGDDCSHSSN
jgi:hypothetical protein